MIGGGAAYGILMWLTGTQSSCRGGRAASMLEAAMASGTEAERPSEGSESLRSGGVVWVTPLIVAVLVVAPAGHDRDESATMKVCP